MPPTYSLTITEADLDAAIARRKQPGYQQSCHCLLAQAVARQEGHPVSVAYSFKPDDNKPHFTLFAIHEATELIDAFDQHDYRAIRPKLPVTFVLPEGDSWGGLIMPHVAQPDSALQHAESPGID